VKQSFWIGFVLVILASDTLIYRQAMIASLQTLWNSTYSEAHLVDCPYLQDIRQKTLHCCLCERLISKRWQSQNNWFYRTGYCFLAISFFVSLSATLRENGWTDLHKIFREGVEWPWNDVFKFRVNLGKRVGGSKVNLFVITGHSSEDWR